MTSLKQTIWLKYTGKTFKLSSQENMKMQDEFHKIYGRKKEMGGKIISIDFITHTNYGIKISVFCKLSFFWQYLYFNSNHPAPPTSNKKKKIEIITIKNSLPSNNNSESI